MTDADALREGGAPGGLPSPTPSPGATSPDGEKVMSLVDHLGELRSRLAKSLLAVAAGSVVGFVAANPIIEAVPALVGSSMPPP